MLTDMGAYGGFSIWCLPYFFYSHQAQVCYCGEPNCVGFIGGKTQTDIVTMDDLYLDGESPSFDPEILFQLGPQPLESPMKPICSSSREARRRRGRRLTILTSWYIPYARMLIFDLTMRQCPTANDETYRRKGRAKGCTSYKTNSKPKSVV